MLGYEKCNCGFLFCNWKMFMFPLKCNLTTVVDLKLLKVAPYKYPQAIWHLQTSANSFNMQPFSFSHSLQTVTKLLIHSVLTARRPNMAGQQKQSLEFIHGLMYYISQFLVKSFISLFFFLPLSLCEHCSGFLLFTSNIFMSADVSHRSLKKKSLNVILGGSAHIQRTVSLSY